MVLSSSHSTGSSSSLFLGVHAPGDYFLPDEVAQPIVSFLLEDMQRVRRNPDSPPKVFNLQGTLFGIMYRIDYYDEHLSHVRFDPTDGVLKLISARRVKGALVFTFSFEKVINRAENNGSVIGWLYLMPVRDYQSFLAMRQDPHFYQ